MLRMVIVLIKSGRVSHSLDALKMARQLVRLGEVWWVDPGLLGKLMTMENEVVKATLHMSTTILRLHSLEHSRMALW